MSASRQVPVSSFHGGIHIPDHKAESNQSPIQATAIPSRLVIPLQQHIGHAAEPQVQVGERVLKGQVIGRSHEYISAVVHAPSSGTITEIGEQPIPHPSGLNGLCIVIETDGLDEWVELPPPWPDFSERDPADLRERIRWAGVVGMGGAAFPTSVKAQPGAGQKIDTLIVNGAECEPYISCDDRLMRERPDRIVAGIRILLHMLSARECLIGIEDNKSEAASALREAIAEADLGNVQVVVVPTKYPSGGEKQLIKLLTGKEVPSHGLPSEIGLLCQNVATVAAIAAAVLDGLPLLSRVVTVTGGGVATPGNFEVLIGTPAAEVIAAAGGYTEHAHRLVLGGPMMGFALHHDQVPVTKAANCFLVADEQELPDPQPAQACIRCAHCVEVCPALLLPQQLYWYARAKDFDKIQDYHLFDCIECGCCAHVCPSHIPLVQYYRFAKTEIWASERERRRSELARRRHDLRVARLARIEQERQARLRKKKDALAKKPAGGQAEKAADDKDPKKAAIEAAMKRVAAKKAAAKKEGEPPPEPATAATKASAPTPSNQEPQ